MMTPRRRGTAVAALATIVALASACGDDEALDPQLRAPEPGSYAYEALVYTDEGLAPDTFTGQLIVSVSSEDSIVGTWDVDGYESSARGLWNITAYALMADPAPPVQGSITHRVTREPGSAHLSCDLTYLHEMPADTFTSSAENSCSLERN